MWLLLVVGLVVLFCIGWYYLWTKFGDPMNLSPADFPWKVSKEESLATVNAKSEEKFLIIGAGFGGLGLAAACRRHGIPFDIVDGSDEIGGNWHHGVYETVHIISSRLTTEYKDFRMPENYPDFPSKDLMKKYLESYADHYEIRKSLSLNTWVEKVNPLDAVGNSYEVLFAKGVKKTYKGVIIANGHHWNKRIPEYPGTFTGEILHSKDYKKPHILEGKRVLVVGGGNSACDISVEAARFAKESHISLRNGYWFLPRCFFGKPTMEILKCWMPFWLQTIIQLILVRITWGAYSNYNLQEPDHLPFDRHITINSELLNFIKLGEITPHRDIKRFEGKTVHFIDGSSQEVDMIIYATGFHQGLPPIDHLIEYEGGVPQVIWGTLHPKLKNIFVLGLGQYRYGAGPCITFGSDFLAKTLIPYQEQYDEPLGIIVTKAHMAIYLKRGKKTPDVQIDPFSLYLKYVAFNKIFEYFPTIASLVGYKPKIKT